MANKNYSAIRDPGNPPPPEPKDTQAAVGPLRYQNNFQPLSNFYPRIWRPKLPRRSFIRTATRHDCVRNTWITILYDNASYVPGRWRAIHRAHYLCNTQFCSFTPLYTDQVTSCFLSATNTIPSPVPLMLSVFYYLHHLPGNHDAPDLQFASHFGKTLTGQKFYISCLKDWHPENSKILL